MGEPSNDTKNVKPFVAWVYVLLMVTATYLVCYNLIMVFNELNNSNKFTKEKMADFIKPFQTADLRDSSHASIIYSIPALTLDSALTQSNNSNASENTEYDKKLLILITLCGALGSLIYILSSFTNFWGNNKLEKSWLAWYVTKPFVGAGLAIIGYFILRAGFFTSSISGSDVNLYGILAFSCFMGLFSDDATLKLKELFDAMFKTKDNRVGKLEENNNNVNSAGAENSQVMPATNDAKIAELIPREIKAITSNEITITGNNLPTDFQILFNAETLPGENLLEKGVAKIRFTLPPIDENTTEVKIKIRDVSSGKETEAGVILVIK